LFLLKKPKCYKNHKKIKKQAGKLWAIANSFICVINRKKYDSVKRSMKMNFRLFLMREKGGIMKKNLIVDDHPSIRILLTEIAENKGLKVFMAESGEVALQIAKKEALDFVLLDLKLPGIDGIEVLQQLKMLNSSLPVILMTAYGELEMLKKAKTYGLDGNIFKPFDFAELDDFF